MAPLFRDDRINAGWPAYKDTLETVGVKFDAHVYPGTQHGFHNDTTPRYDEAAAKLAWQRTVAFFNEHLKNYVDTSGKPWKARTTGSTQIRLTPETIRAFERADAIKQTFFSFGGTVPSVGFNMVPLDMSANIGRFVLNLEGSEISWEHGPQVSSFMQWPGPNRTHRR